jgi:hypothetical protein
MIWWWTQKKSLRRREYLVKEFRNLQEGWNDLCDADRARLREIVEKRVREVFPYIPVEGLTTREMIESLSGDLPSLREIIKEYKSMTGSDNSPSPN